MTKRSSLPKSADVRCSRLHAFILLTIAFVQISAAFQISDTYQKATSTALQAWSLPHDTSFTFRTWYNEYNPTARVTVYNDPDPVERYTFVSVGNDWPSMLDSSTLSSSSSSTSTHSHKRYSNPIKRAWRRRTLRRMLATARRSFGVVEVN